MHRTVIQYTVLLLLALNGTTALCLVNRPCYYLQFTICRWSSDSGLFFTPLENMLNWLC
jgi:hypothetical protein